MVLSFSLIIVGFVLLVKGADWMVSGASALAKRFAVSDLVIGLTIVAFGTSAPELVVNVVSSYQHHNDIVFGNVIGSNFANLFLILGILGLVRPVAVSSGTVWRELPISMGVVVVVYVLANSLFWNQLPVLSRIDGVILLLFFAGFLSYIYKEMKRDRMELQVDTDVEPMTRFKMSFLIVVGLAGLIAGGKLVVDHAVAVAYQLGVSEKIIGITIVAIGTSLPELVTSVVAAMKQNNNIAFGNIIGSNIFNILLVLPVSALFSPVTYNTSFNTELYILAGGTFILFLSMFTGKKKRLDRWEAAILLTIYIFYTGFLVYRELV